MQCVNNADYSLKCMMNTYYIQHRGKKNHPKNGDMISTTKINFSIKTSSMKQKLFIILGVQMGDTTT